MALGKAVFDRYVLSLHIAGFAQSLVERGEKRCSPRAGQAAAEDADHRHRLLLRAGQERIRRRAQENRHEIAAPHAHPAMTLGMDYGSLEPLPKLHEWRLS